MRLGHSCPLAIAVGSEPGVSNLKFPAVEIEFNGDQQETKSGFREESLGWKRRGKLGGNEEGYGRRQTKLKIA